MKYKIKYLSSANRDILLISEFLSEHPNKARRLFKEMDTKLQMLRDTPNMWPFCGNEKSYRKMVLEDCVVCYLVDSEKYEVKVYKVLHNGLSITTKLLTF